MLRAFDWNTCKELTVLGAFIKWDLSFLKMRCLGKSWLDTISTDSLITGLIFFLFFSLSLSINTLLTLLSFYFFLTSLYLATDLRRWKSMGNISVTNSLILSFLSYSFYLYRFRCSSLCLFRICLSLAKWEGDWLYSAAPSSRCLLFSLWEDPGLWSSINLSKFFLSLSSSKLSFC